MTNNDRIIKELFGPNQAQILKLFFHSPNLSLSVEDIAKRTRLKKNAVQKILATLIKLEILKICKNGQKKTGKK